MKDFFSVLKLVGEDIQSLLSSGDFHDLNVRFDCKEICLFAKTGSLNDFPSLNQDTLLIFAESDQVVLRFCYEYLRSTE